MTDRITVETPHVNSPETRPLDYQQVPASWLDAPSAVNHVPEDTEAVRLYAVSAARAGDWIIVRYLHPRGGVKTKHCTATEGPDGWYPRALERDSPADWPRSIVPERGDDPDGEYRGPELDWLDDLWGDREVFDPAVVA